MCEQCLTNCVSFGEPLKGYFLMRARREGNDWHKGEWGLVQVNDPSFTWVSTPVATENYYDVPDNFIDAFDCDPRSGYELIMAAIEKGYNPKEDRFYHWFFNYLANWLKTAEMVEQGDPFPNREEVYPSDLTIGRDPIESEKDIR